MKTVIDSGVVMNSTTVPDLDSDVVIAQSVYDEVKSSQARHLLDAIRSRHHLSVIEPDIRSVEEARLQADKVGQNRLSAQDIDVLAVCLMMSKMDDVLLVSDDFGVRNVAHGIGIPSRGATTEGGTELRTYGYRCSGCGTVFWAPLPECDVCGHTTLKRFRKS